MALVNRRTGIAGITVGAVLCLICGVPFIAALAGFGGVSLSVIISDLSSTFKVSIITGSLVILVLAIVILKQKRSRTKSRAGQ